jgi:uncharacterized protein (TIGR02145 family)
MKIGDFSFSRKSNIVKITDKIEKLTELKNLYEGGYISLEEFNRLKGEITGAIEIEQSKTVKISDQTWMLENLNVNTFRNGDLIFEAKSEDEWTYAGKDERPAWCHYANRPANGKIYGKLYNWYAVNDSRGLSPNNWHIPSDEDWHSLINILGGELVAGAKIKEAGTAHWESPNTGTNRFGLTVLPGGCRSIYGGFSYIGLSASYWSSTERTENLGSEWSMICTYRGITRTGSLKAWGFSVRCLMDN